MAHASRHNINSYVVQFLSAQPEITFFGPAPLVWCCSGVHLFVPSLRLDHHTTSSVLFSVTAQSHWRAISVFCYPVHGAEIPAPFCCSTGNPKKNCCYSYNILRFFSEEFNRKISKSTAVGKYSVAHSHYHCRSSCEAYNFEVFVLIFYHYCEWLFSLSSSRVLNYAFAASSHFVKAFLLFFGTKIASVVSI